METDSETTTPEAETQESPEPLSQESPEPLSQETVAPIPVALVEPAVAQAATSAPVDPATSAIAESLSTVEPHQDDILDDKEPAAQDGQEAVNQISDESEYEAGETSESSVEYSFRDRYNVGKAKKKTHIVEGDTAKETSQKRSIRELASTPPGSDQEGSAKKTFKQQEDIQIDEDEQSVSSPNKSL
jgi:hypothetical protein